MTRWLHSQSFCPHSRPTITCPYLPIASVTTATAMAKSSARDVVRRRSLWAATTWWAM